MPLPTLLGLLTAAPSIFEAAGGIIEAVTGAAPPEDAQASPEAMVTHIEGLPPADRKEVVLGLEVLRVQVQRLDTRRFENLTEGPVEKVRATARPEIARRAMGVIATFAQVFRVVFFAIVLEWAVRAVAATVGHPLPEVESLPQLIAGMAPVSEMIWAPLIASFWASVEIVKKYMGVRERDKAHEYELHAGRPLNALNATIEAAGGTLAGLVRAVRR